MKEDRPPLTFRQQGIIAAAMCAAMIGFYTLLGVLWVPRGEAFTSPTWARLMAPRWWPPAPFPRWWSAANARYRHHRIENQPQVA